MTEVYFHPGRIALLSQERFVQLRELVAKSADADHNPDDLFYFRAEISNDLLDSHYTHMSAKTLANYAEDANRGVAFLAGHDWRSLPIGYSLTGTLETTNNKQRVVADFYTVKGLNETDSLITRIKTGLLRDVSVGFSKGRMICDICSRDFWDCEHIPGLKYQTKNGDVVSEVTSTFTIDDSRLNEVSGVFDGSTPDAMITKVVRMAENGLLDQRQISLIENHFRITLPGVSRVFPVAKLEETTGMTEEMIARAKVILGVETDEEIVERLDNLTKRLGEIEPQAEEGRQYRKDLIAEALAEGVRAQGNDFDTATYQSVLERSPLAVVKRMRDDWKKNAEQNLHAGRASTDNTKEDKKSKVALIPDEAYGG